MFIKLTKEDGLPVMINVNHIIDIEMTEDHKSDTYAQYRIVNTTRSTYKVRESYAAIAKMLEQMISV